MKTLCTFLLIFIIITFFTGNCFTQWIELYTGVTEKLNSVSSVKNITTWACGNNSTIIKSSNTGDNWESANNSGIPTGYTLNHVYALSADIIFVCGTFSNSAYLFKTSNGGISWQTVKTQSAGKFNSLHFIDNSTGFLSGDPVGGRWSLWKTNNGGINWDSVNCYIPQLNNEKGFNNSLWATGNLIWIGTDNYHVYLTTNFGSTWGQQTTGSEKNSSSLWFDFDYNIGYTGNNNLMKTTNSGNTWFVESIPGTGLINGVTGSAHARYNWAIRENKIYVNPHNENSWIYDYTSPGGNYTYITIEKNGYFGGAVFASRDNGGISRTIFITIGIENISTEIPNDYRLFQNYPNPFNPVTRIKFDIPESEKVSLKIFDINGKLVKILADEFISAGSYSVNWDAGNTGSGIYFCKLIAGKKTITNKMILLK